jgi:hypothetical protein
MRDVVCTTTVSWGCSNRGGKMAMDKQPSQRGSGHVARSRFWIVGSCCVPAFFPREKISYRTVTLGIRACTLSRVRIAGSLHGRNVCHR